MQWFNNLISCTDFNRYITQSIETHSTIQSNFDLLHSQGLRTLCELIQK